MDPAEQQKVKRRLNGLLYVPPGEVDDTRFELFHTSLRPCMERGPEVLADFLALGAITVLRVLWYISQKT